MKQANPHYREIFWLWLELIFPVVTVLGMDIKFAIKQAAKNKDAMPNYQATLAFYRLNLEKYSI